MSNPSALESIIKRQSDEIAALTMSKIVSMDSFTMPVSFTSNAYDFSHTGPGGSGVAVHTFILRLQPSQNKPYLGEFALLGRVNNPNVLEEPMFGVALTFPETRATYRELMPSGLVLRYYIRLRARGSDTIYIKYFFQGTDSVEFQI